MALLEALAVLERELGRSPSTVELLEFTRQRLVERSPRSPDRQNAAPSCEEGGGANADDEPSAAT